MKHILKKSLILLCTSSLILLSCNTPSKVACPTFETKKVSKRIYTTHKTRQIDFSQAFSFNKRSSLKVQHTSQHIGASLIPKIDERANKFASNTRIHSHELSHSFSNVIEQNQNRDHKIESSAPSNRKKTRKALIGVSTTPLIKKKGIKSIEHKNQVVQSVEKSKRKVAIIKGGSIILMAIIAAISIPALGTLTASIGLIAIFLLDILISISVFNYYKKDKPELAKTTSLLRLIYTVIFGVGIGYHIAGNVAMFNKFWSIGLIAFGLHLIALGILFNNEGGKKWVNIVIKSLLITAGIGYLLLNVGLLLVPNPITFSAIVESIFLLPQILGETSFGIWMIFKGGKKNKQQ